MRTRSLCGGESPEVVMERKLRHTKKTVFFFQWLKFNKKEKKRKHTQKIWQTQRIKWLEFLPHDKSQVFGKKTYGGIASICQI